MSMWSNWDSEIVKFLKKYERDTKSKTVLLNHEKHIQSKNSALKICDFKNAHSIISDGMGSTLM